MSALATVKDICDREGLVEENLSAIQKTKIEKLLEDASAYIRRESGQNFTAGTSTAVLRKGQYWAVTLPQRPVTSIVSVKNFNGDDVEVNATVVSGKVVFDKPLRDVVVEYTHGYTDIPADIVALVCGVVQRTMNISDSARKGIASHQVGQYQISFAGWAQGGNITLSPAEQKILSGYKIPLAGRIYSGV